MTLRVLVADDEMLARKRLVRLLTAIDGVEVVAECASGDEALDRIGKGGVDLALFDINMPGISGIDAKALLGDGGPHVIFATAHPEHAVAAFEFGAVDYVLKPIDAARLAKAIDRARRHCELREPSAPSPTLVRVPVTTRAGVLLLDPQCITHAEFDGTLVTLHRSDGEPLLTELSLQELAQRLPEPEFVRVHRRALVNLRALAMLQPQGTGGFVGVTHQGATVPVSRQAARRLRRWLGLGKGGGDEG